MSDPSAIIAAALHRRKWPTSHGQSPPTMADEDEAYAVVRALEAEGYTIARLQQVGSLEWCDVGLSRDRPEIEPTDACGTATAGTPLYRILPEEDR